MVRCQEGVSRLQKHYRAHGCPNTEALGAAGPHGWWFKDGCTLSPMYTALALQEHDGHCCQGEGELGGGARGEKPAPPTLWSPGRLAGEGRVAGRE